MLGLFDVIWVQRHGWLVTSIALQRLKCLLFTARRSARAVYDIWPYVRPSVTSRCSVNTAKHNIMKTKLHDSLATLVLWCKTSWWNSSGVTPNGASDKRGEEIYDFQQITYCISKTVQDGHVRGHQECRLFYVILNWIIDDMKCQRPTT